MSGIQDLFQQAQLAEAAYANLSGMKISSLPETLALALTTGDGTFSAAQATTFLVHWRVVDHLQNQSSGFSATVFESLTIGVRVI